MARRRQQNKIKLYAKIKVATLHRSVISRNGFRLSIISAIGITQGVSIGNIARVRLLQLIHVEQRQVAADPSTKPTELGGRQVGVHAVIVYIHHRHYYYYYY